MNNPKVTENYFKERAGVLEVAAKLNSFGLIFRETPNADLGIDGQIEHIDSDGNATGKIVAVQIKYGDSYLSEKNGNIVFRSQEKHISYWSNFPIPVILFVHSPRSNITYFTDVRYQFNIPKRKNNNIIFTENDIYVKPIQKKFLKQLVILIAQFWQFRKFFRKCAKMFVPIQLSILVS